MAKVNYKKMAKEIEEQTLDNIDEEIEKINKRLVRYDALIETRNRLQAARRAVLGGSKATGEGGTQLRAEDIVRFLRDNPGSTPGEIAEEYNVKQPTVSSALYRGKNERYLSKDGRWWLRSPKDGINTAEDIEDEEDE